MFNPNDKIVCINAAMTAEDIALFSECLVDGRIYAVRSVDPEIYHDGHQNLHLVGIAGHIFHDGEEVGFHSARFRKLGDGRARETTTAGAAVNPAIIHAASGAGRSP